jgi:hypothetical protein
MSSTDKPCTAQPLKKNNTTYTMESMSDKVFITPKGIYSK